MSMIAQKVVTIYLAGGMRSNWQDVAQAEFCQEHKYDGESYVRFMDPRDWAKGIAKNFTDEQRSSKINLEWETAYTTMDIKAIDESDVLVGYLEESNTSGAGLSLEIGYAKAKGKKIHLFIDEAHPSMRYWGMARVLADSYVIVKDEQHFKQEMNALAKQLSI